MHIYTVLFYRPCRLVVFAFLLDRWGRWWHRQVYASTQESCVSSCFGSMPCFGTVWVDAFTNLRCVWSCGCTVTLSCSVAWDLGLGLLVFQPVDVAMNVYGVGQPLVDIVFISLALLPILPRNSEHQRAMQAPRWHRQSRLVATSVHYQS